MALFPELPDWWSPETAKWLRYKRMALNHQQYQQNNHGIYVDLNLYCYSEAEIFVIAHTLGYAT